MPNEDNRAGGRSPMSEKCSDVVFASRIVSRTKQGIVESNLSVNHDESVSHRFTVPPSTPAWNSLAKQLSGSARVRRHPDG